MGLREIAIGGLYLSPLLLYALIGLAAALVAALEDRQALSPRHRAMIAGLVGRLDLALHLQAEWARTAQSPPATATFLAPT
ncbi:hypothetical protein [Halomonas stenophila]|uniref:Uncharacterized protein n=1 Tax=Halomonas stenophila TaxID=795312 RepID=A0A7W5ET81_9GAMM|nr:hypothetical protein [Halomonas stenophila]MBB3230993.1 hypothetical protein [Halomonas stenophila]